MPGIYISYPFCAQKCTYCNFASGVFPEQLASDYLEVLRAEIAAHPWSWQPETVYLGGGTPSQLAPEALEQLLSTLPGRPWLEATLEAAPGGLTPERAAAWRQAGINRVSFGVQSFVQREIARSGRKHTAEIVAAEVTMLRDAGIEEINLDLIAGLSGQTEASWRQSLDWIERLAPPHVSIYMLEVDEDSRLGQEILLGGKRYGASDVPSDAEIVAFYEVAVERLERMGVRRYEISNFARRGSESRHNLKYWRLEPYIGFGADAHSMDGGLRWQNVESAAEYVARWREGRSVRAESVEARPEEERFFVGLRLSEGIELRPEDRSRFEEPIRRFLDAGLLEESGARLRLTPQGVVFSNEVFQEFVEL